MCLYPKLVKNPKYKPNKKNGGHPPKCKDNRLLYVSVGCGKCIECLKQKSRMWQVRLINELSEKQYVYFVTFTFSNENLIELMKEFNCKQPNPIAGKAIRRFLERWRKKHKISLKHFLITELGHKNTERIHLHGLIFNKDEIDIKELEQTWKYGNIWVGEYVSIKTINYITKYITKLDKDHKGYVPQIFCSAGIGKQYTQTWSFEQRKYRGLHTIEYYTMPNGYKINMPIYYRNKLYNEEEREQLWINKINEHKIWVMGVECDISTEAGIKHYNEVLKQKQQENIKMGYGDDTKEWRKRPYNMTLKQLNIKEKIYGTNKEKKMKKI